MGPIVNIYTLSVGPCWHMKGKKVCVWYYLNTLPCAHKFALVGRETNETGGSGVGILMPINRGRYVYSLLHVPAADGFKVPRTLDTITIILSLMKRSEELNKMV